MASMRMDIVVRSQDVEAAIRVLGYTTSPPALAYFMNTRAKQWLQRRARQRFAEEGDDAVGAWKELKESTVDIRQAQGFVPIRINRRTSAMHNWVTRADGQVLASQALTQLTWPGTPTSAEMTKKIMTAQRGSSSPRTVPRPVIGVSETDLFVLLELLGDFVLSAEMIAALR